MIWRNKEGRVRLIWRLVGILMLFIVLMLCFGWIISFIGTGLGHRDTVTAWLDRWIIHINSMSLLVATALFAFGIDKMSFRDMGLPLRGRIRELAFGLGLGGGLVLTVFALHLALGNVDIEAVVWPGARGSILSGLLLFTLVSLNEELLGRGYFLNHFCGRLDLAVIFSSLFFAVLHLGNTGVTPLAIINLTLAGALFALMYLWSGSLWMPIGFHLTWNWVMGSILGYAVSGGADDALIRISISGPDLITGGRFGPEGGLPVTILLIAGIFLVRWFLRRKGFPCPWRGHLSSQLSPVLE